MRPAKYEKSLFSKRLICLRQQKGMTQAQLAHLMDVPRSTIDYYEARASNPRANTLQKLAQVFGVTPDFFLLEDVEESLRVQQLPEAKKQELRQIIQEFLDENS